jgi:hypothetical protein
MEVQISRVRRKTLVEAFANPNERLRHERRRNVQKDPENLRSWPW